MAQGFRIFFWGMLISFLGSLPLGTLNVAAMQIGIQESVGEALYFSFGSLLVEMVYVRLSLTGINWVRRQHRLMRIMEWITLLIVVLLATGSFRAAFQEGGQGHNVMLDNPMPRFLLGMFMCAINPVQIPFWFGWSTVLFSKGILVPGARAYNLYIVGIGLGTLMGNAVFIFGGRWAVDRLSSSEYYLNLVIGSIFAITAIIQAIKIIRKKKEVGETGV